MRKLLTVILVVVLLKQISFCYALSPDSFFESVRNIPLTAEEVIALIEKGKFTDKEIFIFDYDGTLALKKKPIQAKTIKALLKLIDMGKTVIIVSNGDIKRLQADIDNSLLEDGTRFVDKLSGNKHIWVFEGRGGGAYKVNSNGYKKHPELSISFAEDKIRRVADLLTSVENKFNELGVKLKLFSSETMIFIRFSLRDKTKIAEILDYLKRGAKERQHNLSEKNGPFIDEEPFAMDLEGNKGVDVEKIYYHAWFVSTDKGSVIERKIVPILGAGDMSKASYYGDSFKNPGDSDVEVQDVVGLQTIDVENPENTLRIIEKYIEWANSSKTPDNSLQNLLSIGA